MRVADILSDLTSLRVCDQTAALALVSARPTSGSQADNNDNTLAQSSSHAYSTVVPDSVEGDVDLTRARDLLELHASVKVANTGGLDRTLGQAREDVDRALRYM